MRDDQITRIARHLIDDVQCSICAYVANMLGMVKDRDHEANPDSTMIGVLHARLTAKRC